MNEMNANLIPQNDVTIKMQNALIMVLADMVERRDQSTGDHIRKTASYCTIIADEMAKKGYYKDILTEEYVQNTISAAPLHDIGKIAIPDAVLNKPGKLTDEEFEKMKTHTVVGGEVISKIMDRMKGAEVTYLPIARDVALYHHEKWNGKGYPKGLKGEEIPLCARIMAVADVFDALTSERSYKKPFPLEKAISIIEEGAGEHFDPLVVDAFKSALDDIKMILETFSA